MTRGEESAARVVRAKATGVFSKPPTCRCRNQGHIRKHTRSVLRSRTLRKALDAANCMEVATSSAWKVQKKHTSFFTGGLVSLSKDESTVLTPCSDRVAVLDISTGEIRRKLQDSISVRPARTLASSTAAL